MQCVQWWHVNNTPKTMCVSVCAHVHVHSHAGSWTTWSTTWSWKSKTARAGKATQLASIAIDSTWLLSSCSATSRAPTARSNPQVRHHCLNGWIRQLTTVCSNTGAFCDCPFHSLLSQLQDMWAGIWVRAGSPRTHEGQPQARRDALRLPGPCVCTPLWFSLIFSLVLKFCFTDSTGLQLQILFLLRSGDTFPKCPWQHKRVALSLLSESS